MRGVPTRSRGSASGMRRVSNVPYFCPSSGCSRSLARTECLTASGLKSHDDDGQRFEQILMAFSLHFVYYNFK